MNTELPIAPVVGGAGHPAEHTLEAILSGTDQLRRSEPIVSSFRPIHYIGNKSRYLDAIEAVINEVAAPNSTVCDLFAGTAVVARRLAHTRPVVCADIQAYSSVLAQALTAPRAFSEVEVEDLVDLARVWMGTLQPSIGPLLDVERRASCDVYSDPAPLADLVEFGSLTTTGKGSRELRQAKEAARKALSPEIATITWYYGGVYFSYRQALELDALRHAVRALRSVEDDASTAVASLLGTASDVVSTVGSHFAQPVQPRKADGTLKHSWITSVMRTREYSVLGRFQEWLGKYGGLSATPYKCVAIQGDYRTVLSGLGSEVGAIYADPPYTRDHYSRFYHVLETLALDDDPGVTSAPGTAEPSRGIYRVKRHQSPFSIRTQARPAFQELFAHAKRLDIPVVLSYSPMSGGTKARPETRLMSIQDLIGMAESYFNDVRLVDVASSVHSRFNRAELNAAVDGSAEVLLVARN